METETTEVRQSGLSVATRVAPEDLAVGDYLGVLFNIEQHVVIAHESASFGEPPPLHVMNTRMIPRYQQVLQVKALTLPLVLTEDTDGDLRVMDTRTNTFVRVDAAFAAAARRPLMQTRRRKARKRAALQRQKQDSPGRFGSEGAD